MELSSMVTSLIFEFEQNKTLQKDHSRPDVSRAVSAIAVLYEKARNAVEFRAEHLVRRAAIERILKRRFMLNGGSPAIAENLITELLWARYIDSALIDEGKIQEIQAIVDRYHALRHSANPSAGGTPLSWDTLMGLASSEIEECIVSPKRRLALTNFVYQAINPRVRVKGIDEQYLNMLTYIAVERAFSQSDDALISLHLLRVMKPEWLTTSPAGIPAQIEGLVQTTHLIQSALGDQIGDALFRYIRARIPPFLLLRDFFLETGEKSRSFIEDKSLFQQKLAEIAARRYQETGAKVRRAVVRSFVYIFLTKMLFALALEAPYDIYIAKKITYLPLAVNTLFPPVLLFLVAGLFSVPGNENTRRLIETIEKIIYQFDEQKENSDVFVPKPRVRRPVLTGIFSLFYLATFGITFGIINLILTKLHFNIASQIIFVFFVALVSFFAYRIRHSAKEYEVIERQGIFEPAVDFFFLPILRAGHILSREIARINVFIFLFDFILEAPLKVIFEVVEEWIRFVRTKKEEII